MVKTKQVLVCKKESQKGCQNVKKDVRMSKRMSKRMSECQFVYFSICVFDRKMEAAETVKNYVGPTRTKVGVYQKLWQSE